MIVLNILPLLGIFLFNLIIIIIHQIQKLIQINKKFHIKTLINSKRYLPIRMNDQQIQTVINAQTYNFSHIIFILNLSQTIFSSFLPLFFYSLCPMFEQKLKPNRKKNLSSKIIVDQYDHLIKNSKMQPNYDTFLDPPLSPHFIPKDSKIMASKQQSSESEYSMHQQNQQPQQKQCSKCGDMFQQRIYNSHLNICQKRVVISKKEEEKPSFNKKDEYNLFSMNQSIDPDHKLMKSARNKGSKKQTDDLLDSRKQIELKKQTSKKSIGSLQKKGMNRPSSSTRNKLQIKGHQNLKQKILNKLQGTKKKNPQSKEDHIKRVSSSQNKHTSSNSRPKSINKNVQRFGLESKKFSTINSSSINKKKLPSQNGNYEFNRSEIMSGFQSDPRKKEKAQFISKANIKEEKKQTLKKKNINYNNSFVGGQQFQRQKEKSFKNEGIFNLTENNSYMAGQRKYENVFQKERQQLRQQLKKEGLFRRESSSSASKRNYKNRQQERQQKPPRGTRQVNDEYYFFQNHPSSVPSHYIKRQEEPYSRYDHVDLEETYQNNSSKIIRNKLGINKNLTKQKQTQNINKKTQQRNKMQTEQEMIQSRSRQQKFVDSQLFQRQIIHRRTNSSRENNRNQKNNKPNPNTQYINGDINRTQARPEQRNLRNQLMFPGRNLNQQTRTRPQNPMGNDRLPNQRRQAPNRPQNRPQQRITNQRMNSSHNQTNRQQPNPNGVQRIQQPVRGQNNRTNLRNEQRRPQTQQQRRRPQQQQGRRQQQQARRPEQQQRRRNQGQRTEQQQRTRNEGQRRQNSRQGTSRRQNRRQGGSNGPQQRIQQQTLNFISNTLNQQFQVMNGHFNLLNNIFSNFSNIVNVNITASTNNQNPTTFVFRNHNRRRHHPDASHSSYSDFSSDFSQDDSVDNQTDYDEDQYYYEEQQQQDENPGMTQHQISSIPVLRYNKDKHGHNQCTICLVQLAEKQPFKKLFCDHVFHTQCIDQWLKRKNACPVCRDQMGVTT